MSSKHVYFTSLVLENVRAYGDRQKLSLTTSDGSTNPAQWTLIIGENGVGKTTLLQCLAKMRPVPNWRNKQDKSSDEMTDCVTPAFQDELENEPFDALVRTGENVHLKLEATLSVGVPLDKTDSGSSSSIFTRLMVERKGGEVEAVDSDGTDLHDFKEPLVIGYGASRHMGSPRSMKIDLKVGVSSLFDDSVKLVNAEDILQDLDYSEFKEAPGTGKLLNRLKEALATILPDVRASEDIKIYAPKALGLKGKKGVHVRTPYGEVPFSSLSLGYQTMSAWTIDIAWRLFQENPESENPLSESAIVLVDEIDLHLHPRWQRRIRTELSKHFPNVQFIATAHSPLMAQSYLDANIVVIRRDENQAIIVNEPFVVRGWRLDQILTSELFGLASARPPDIENKMQRQQELAQKIPRSDLEQQELDKLDLLLRELPTEESHSDNQAMAIIRRAADALEKTRPNDDTSK